MFTITALLAQVQTAHTAKFGGTYRVVQHNTQGGLQTRMAGWGRSFGPLQLGPTAMRAKQVSLSSCVKRGGA